MVGGLAEVSAGEEAGVLVGGWAVAWAAAMVWELAAVWAGE